MWRRRAVRCGLWRRRRAVARRAAEAGACSWRRHLPAVAVPEPLQMAAALVPSEVAHADFLAGQRHLLTNIHRRHGRRGSSTSPLSGGGHEREVETLRRHRDALAWLRREQEPRGQLLDMECRVRGTERRHEQCTASSHTACTAAVYSAAICIVQGRVDDESGGRTVYLASSFSPV
uniref:Uncharacterized protein n=1 Tax=Arundo donax TaxID=35708 RepID=A0A0A9HKD1_ARUDO